MVLVAKVGRKKKDRIQIRLPGRIRTWTVHSLLPFAGLARPSVGRYSGGPFGEKSAEGGRPESTKSKRFRLERRFHNRNGFA